MPDRAHQQVEQKLKPGLLASNDMPMMIVGYLHQSHKGSFPVHLLETNWLHYAAFYPVRNTLGSYILSAQPADRTTIGDHFQLTINPPEKLKHDIVYVQWDREREELSCQYADRNDLIHQKIIAWNELRIDDPQKKPQHGSQDEINVIKEEILKSILSKEDTLSTQVDPISEGWRRYQSSIRFNVTPERRPLETTDAIETFKSEYHSFFQGILAENNQGEAHAHANAPESTRFPTPKTVSLNIEELRKLWQAQTENTKLGDREPFFLFIKLCHWFSSLIIDMNAVQQANDAATVEALFADYPISKALNLEYLTPRALFAIMRRGKGAHLMMHIGPTFLPLLRQFTDEMIAYLPQAMRSGPSDAPRFYLLTSLQMGKINPGQGILLMQQLGDQLYYNYGPDAELPPRALPYGQLLFKKDGDPRYTIHSLASDTDTHFEILLQQQDTLQGLWFSTADGLFDAVSHSEHFNRIIMLRLIENPNHPYFSKLSGNQLFDMFTGKYGVSTTSRLEKKWVREFLRIPALVDRFTGGQLVELIGIEKEIIQEFMRNPNNVARLTGAEWVKLLGADQELIKEFMRNPDNVARLTGKQCVEMLVGKHEAIVQFIEYQDEQGQFSNILKLHDGTISQNELKIKKGLYESYYTKCPLAGQSGISKALVLEQLHHPQKVRPILQPSTHSDVTPALQRARIPAQPVIRSPQQSDQSNEQPMHPALIAKALLREKIRSSSADEVRCLLDGLTKKHKLIIARVHFSTLTDFTDFLSHSPLDLSSNDAHLERCDLLYNALHEHINENIHSTHDLFTLSLHLGKEGKNTLYGYHKSQTIIKGWRKAYPQLKDQYLMLLRARFGYLGYQDDTTKYRPEVSWVTQWSICCIVFLFTFPIQLAPDYVVRGQMNWLSGRSGPLSYPSMKFFRSQRAIFAMDLDDRQRHQSEQRGLLRVSAASF